jgi:restriction endonuclease S subunit
MMRSSALRLLSLATLICMNSFSHSQPNNPGNPETAVNVKTTPKPYKVLTSGRQVTIKSEKIIKSIMLWTASGHRVLEQNEINALLYSFNISVSEKIFFVMVQLENGKLYTEKFGLQ